MIINIYIYGKPTQFSEAFYTSGDKPGETYLNAPWPWTFQKPLHQLLETLSGELRWLWSTVQTQSTGSKSWNVLDMT